MRSHSAPVNSDAVLIEKFVSYKENTMNEIVSSSVGMAILLLKKNYFGETPDQTAIDAAIVTCVKELETYKESTTDESTQLAIKYILNKIKESIDEGLDKAVLYLKTPQGWEDVKLTFPLSETLMLVWKALHDHEKFINSYENLFESERLEAAKSDFPNRLQSLFNRIENNRLDPVCHHGDRNELVFSLTDTYEGIHLIESGKLTTHAFLRENTLKLFWEKYTSAKADSKKELRSALFNWMSTNNPGVVLSIVDPEDKIKNELRELFIKNGSNPERIKFDQLVADALPSISFSCDEREHPALYKINEILSTVDIENEPARNSAIAHMQQWIINHCQPEDVKDQRFVADFHLMFESHKTLSDYRKLQASIGRAADDFIELEKNCDMYFKAFPGNMVPPEGTAETLEQVKKRIDECKKDTLVDKVQSFYAQWVDAEQKMQAAEAIVQANPLNPLLEYDASLELEKNFDKLKQLYAFLIDENTKSKITLVDVDKQVIDEFIQFNETWEQNITPYQINRVFLNALIFKSAEWDDAFTEVFAKVLKHVRENYLTKPSLSCFSETAINNLEYRLRSKTEKLDRPKDLIVLPEQVQSAEEWFFVSKLLSKKKLNEKYRNLSAKINPTLLNKICDSLSNNEDPFANFLRSLDSIPYEQRLAFIKFFNTKSKDLFTSLLQNDIENFYTTFNFLLKTDWIPFLKILDKEQLIGIITDSEVLAKFLEGLDLDHEESMMPYLETLGTEILQNLIKDRQDFGRVMSALPKADHMAFIHLLGIDLVKNIIGDTFCDTKWFFVTDLETDVLQAIITDYATLKHVLESTDSKLIILKKLGFDTIKKIVKTASELSFILSTFDKGQLVEILIGLEPDGLQNIVKNMDDLKILLQAKYATSAAAFHFLHILGRDNTLAKMITCVDDLIFILRKRDKDILSFIKSLSPQVFQNIILTKQDLFALFPPILEKEQRVPFSYIDNPHRDDIIEANERLKASKSLRNQCVFTVLEMLGKDAAKIITNRSELEEVLFQENWIPFLGLIFEKDNISNLAPFLSDGVLFKRTINYTTKVSSLTKLFGEEGLREIVLTFPVNFVSLLGQLPYSEHDSFLKLIFNNNQSFQKIIRSLDDITKTLSIFRYDYLAPTLRTFIDILIANKDHLKTIIRTLADLRDVIYPALHQPADRLFFIQKLGNDFLKNIEMNPPHAINEILHFLVTEENKLSFLRMIVDTLESTKFITNQDDLQKGSKLHAEYWLPFLGIMYEKGGIKSIEPYINDGAILGTVLLGASLADKGVASLIKAFGETGIKTIVTAFPLNFFSILQRLGLNEKEPFIKLILSNESLPKIIQNKDELTKTLSILTLPVNATAAITAFIDILSTNKNHLIKIIPTLKDFGEVLEKFQATDRESFIQKLGNDFFKNITINSPSELIVVLTLLTTEQSKKTFISALLEANKSLFNEIIPKCKPEELNDFISLLPQEYKVSFTNFVLWKKNVTLKEFAQNDPQRFGKLLGSLPVDSWSNYLTTLNNNNPEINLSNVIKNTQDLNACLNELPKERKLSFLNFILKNNIELLINVIEANGEESGRNVFNQTILNNLSQDEQQSFNKQFAIETIKIFSAQLKKEYEMKHEKLWFLCPRTKMNKAGRLDTLADNLIKHQGGNWVELVQTAKAFEDGLYFQTFISHRTQYLLQNIIEGHPEKGIVDPKDQKALVWKDHTPRPW